MVKVLIIPLLFMLGLLVSCNYGMSVSENSGQFLVSESGKPVLQYNYRTVDEKEAIDTLSQNPYARSKDDNFRANTSIYAVPRSNYIHPVYGLQEEMLTRDWSKDHPHHRGIYWAWPEVDFGSKRGDLHALQVVFARPTGRIRYEADRKSALVEAENLWMWKDSIPVVQEDARICVYRETLQGRIIDLAFRFVALKDSITIARRETKLYGGLNVRMQTPKKQKITVYTDSSDVVPRRAWSDLSGLFAGAKSPSGMMVFQHHQNPGYPGDWIQYPELSWCQPTFPTSGTRYPLLKGQALVLRFRLFVHNGTLPRPELTQSIWDTFNADDAHPLVFAFADKAP